MKILLIYVWLFLYNKYKIKQQGDVFMDNYTLKNYLLFIDSLTELKHIDVHLAKTPIQEKRWSIKEIIAHIYRWDIFLLEVAIPSALHERIIHFPSHDEYNFASQKFAATISFSQLVHTSIVTRKQLITDLLNMKDSILEPITINNNTHCPKTNERYTVLYLMSEFVEHDQHHLAQIKQFLSQQK